MRSRYHPDGSVDYEADRMLEIIRLADEELERQRYQQAQVERTCATPAQTKPSSTRKAPAANGLNITDFVKDPIAELLKPLIPTNPNERNLP